MAKIALDGATMAQSTIPNHISYRKWEQTGTSPPYCSGGYIDGVCQGWSGGDPIYDWVYYQTNAIVNGTVTASVTNVKVNGKSPIVVGDKTKESDTYSLPSGGVYVSGQHTNVAGSVTVGNNKNVFINGKLAVLNGAQVTTHAGTNTTINGGVSTTVDIGN